MDNINLHSFSMLDVFPDFMSLGDFCEYAWNSWMIRLYLLQTSPPKPSSISVLSHWTHPNCSANHVSSWTSASPRLWYCSTRPCCGCRCTGWQCRCCCSPEWWTDVGIETAHWSHRWAGCMVGSPAGTAAWPGLSFAWCCGWSLLHRSLIFDQVLAFRQFVLML